MAHGGNDCHRQSRRHLGNIQKVESDYPFWHNKRSLSEDVTEGVERHVDFYIYISEKSRYLR